MRGVLIMGNLSYFLINLLGILVSFLCFLGWVNRREIKRSNVELGMFIALTLSITLCMIYPLSIPGGIIFDLRLIPFVLGCFYASRYTSIWLVFLIIGLRLFNGTENAWFAIMTIIVFFLVTINLRKKFKELSTMGKAVLYLLLSLFMTFWILTGVSYFFQSPITLSFSLVYIAIHLIGMILAGLLAEYIRKQHLMFLKLIRLEKAEVASHLASSISHEIRNPLTTSRGFMQLISECKEIPDKERGYLAIAIKELDQAVDIINDYLTFAKPFTENTEVLLAHREITQAIQMVDSFAKKNGIKIKSELKPCMIVGNSGLFRQMLINVMRNGIEAMNGEGILTIETYIEKHNYIITIQDHGVGMSTVQLNRLGEPYFSTKEAKGTGLGMMVVYSIISAMNGTIDVKSTMGVGTSVNLHFPFVTSTAISKIS